MNNPHSEPLKKMPHDTDADVTTIKEIQGQPELWLNIWETIQNETKEIEHFLAPLLKKERLQVVLTGAGSSAFIGKSIRQCFKYIENGKLSAVSTTSLVTHFKNYIIPEYPLLLISFARSGDSPESIAVVDLAEKSCDDIYHIAITCNASGELAKKMEDLEHGLALVLPPEAEDRGLAMTGSFTGMMLAGLLVAQPNRIEKIHDELKSVSQTAKNLLSTSANHFQRIAALDFNRIVFLGSGPLFSIARESHLKVQELTDGLVIGKHDSFLGFRHGPKAVVNEKTLIVYLFSHEERVFRYEKDLAEQIANDGYHLRTIGLFPNQKQSDTVPCDLSLVMNPPLHDDPSHLFLLPYVLPAQMIGVYKSLNLGLTPDSPSRNNAISRVVKGVRIYHE